MAWLKASNPVAWVSLGGIPTISSGSMTANCAPAAGARMGCFTPSELITRPSDISLPVPEVVGITISPGAGSMEAVSYTHLAWEAVM